ncbi:hypothetical protein [Ruegeria arenilitoris]|nr:hypothetical protein [Ruegeria arenilitoris]
MADPIAYRMLSDATSGLFGLWIGSPDAAASTLERTMRPPGN